MHPHHENVYIYIMNHSRMCTMKTLTQKFIFLIFLASPVLCLGQTRKVSGTIVCFNKYPLQNVTVKAKKAKTETVTNAEGKFEIVVKKKDVLRIKERPFVKYNISISETDKELRFNLIFVNTKKNIEAASADYIERKDLEYGIQYLALANNPFSLYVDIYDAIKNSVPEANLVIENGKKVFILRGSTSIQGSNAAMYLVNGVLTDDISYIEPDQIIRIFKLGNQAAAFYGSRAGNGIISIETR